MALDLSAITSLPATDRVTLGLTDVQTEIALPTGIASYRASFQFITNAGALSEDGSDGGALGADYYTVPADAGGIPLIFTPGDDCSSAPKVYASSATGSTVLEVLIDNWPQDE